MEGNSAALKKAEEISTNHNIDEVNKTADVMSSAVTALKDVKGRNNKPLSEKKKLKIVANRLDEALKYLEPEKAFSLFRESDVKSLLTFYNPYYKLLVSKKSPFFTREELAGVIRKFSVYLKENKGSLLDIGYPKKSFEKSILFHWRLSRLYPIKIGTPLNVIKDNDTPKKDKDGNFLLKYRWREKWGKWRVVEDDDSQKDIWPTYEEAFPIEELRDEDIEDILENRSKVFRIKIDILNISNKYLDKKRKNKKGFFEECMKSISKELTKEAFDKLHRIEKAYLTALRGIHPVDLTQSAKRFEAGGVKDILNFIFFVEEELNIGRMHNTKTAFLDLTGGDNIPGNYFEMVSAYQKSILDGIIIKYLEYVEPQVELLKEFLKRVESYSRQELKNAVLVENKYLKDAQAMASVIHRGYFAPQQFTPSSSMAKEINPLQVPSGLRWEGITISFHDAENIKIRYGGRPIETNFIEMGFANNYKPNKQWQLFIEFAKRDGVYSFKRPHYDRPGFQDGINQEFGGSHGGDYKKDSGGGIEQGKKKGYSTRKLNVPDAVRQQKMALSRSLQALFKIDEDPLPWYERDCEYRTRFELNGECLRRLAVTYLEQEEKDDDEDSLYVKDMFENLNR